MPEITIELKNYFKKIHKNNINESENLFDSGILDSMGIVDLIAYLEEKFKITIDADDVTEDNFSSIDSITSLVTEKL